MTERIAGLLALLLAAGLMAAPVYAGSAQPGTAPSGSLDGPWVNDSSGVPVVDVAFFSNSTAPINATAFGTIHNSLGQTVAIETSPIVSLMPGQNVTLMFPVSLSIDVYTVDIFVVGPSGVAISAEDNCTVVG